MSSLHEYIWNIPDFGISRKMLKYTILPHKVLFNRSAQTGPFMVHENIKQMCTVHVILLLGDQMAKGFFLLKCNRRDWVS